MAQSNGDEELRHNIRLELGSMKVEEYGTTPQSETLENIIQLFEAYRKQHELEAKKAKAIEIGSLCGCPMCEHHTVAYKATKEREML